jgi:hypothetical protein
MERWMIGLCLLSIPGSLILMFAIAPRFMESLLALVGAALLWLLALVLFIWSFFLPWYFMIMVWILAFIALGFGMASFDVVQENYRNYLNNTGNPDRNS